MTDGNGKSKSLRRRIGTPRKKPTREADPSSTRKVKTWNDTSQVSIESASSWQHRDGSDGFDPFNLLDCYDTDQEIEETINMSGPPAQGYKLSGEGHAGGGPDGTTGANTVSTLIEGPG